MADDVRSRLAAQLLRGEDPLPDYFQRKRIGHNIGSGVYGATAGMAALPALMDNDPISAWLARGIVATTLPLSLDHLNKAGKAADAQRMWQQTGMPAGPVSDADNPYLRMLRLNQMYGGDGD